MRRKLVAFLATALLMAGYAGPAVAQGPTGQGGMGMSPSVAGMPPGMPRMVPFDNAKRLAAAQANVANGAVNNLQQLLEGAQPEPATEAAPAPIPALKVGPSLKAGKYLSGAAALAAFPSPTGCPTPSTTVVDYSGTCVSNYANSPLPLVTTTNVVANVGNPLIARTYASDDTVGSLSSGTIGQGQVLVVLSTPLPAGTLQDFQTYVQGTGNPMTSIGNMFNAYILHPTGTPNQYTVAFDSGTITVPNVADGVQTYLIAGSPAVTAGDFLAFYGQGIPLDVSAGTDVVSYQAVAAPPASPTTFTVGDPATFPLLPGPRTYSFAADIVTGTTTSTSGGIRKFVDSLPGLGAANANDLGSYIPVATPDTTTYLDPNSPTGYDEYYEIELGQYTQQLHQDLPATTLRGYRQTNMGGTPFSYLGPAIVAQKDVPVRIKFTNKLDPILGGNLFIPVDTSTMGAGLGPDGVHSYSSNRATLHLHGGFTPWISDGTPHQWTTPVGANEPYPQGVSVSNVPDMPDPGPGSLTFFYTNQQSARLMFYHDHAYGITRLNVYAGEAAPYVLQDPHEQALVANGTLPDAASTLPLVIQDKTFVPDDAQLMAQDPTWKSVPNVPLNPDGLTAKVGSLWFPHVYMPNQNPADNSGADAMGRWDFAEWFWPPYAGGLTNGSVPNPLCTDPNYGPTSLSCTTMPTVPGTPNPSMVPEGFMDTPLVNGTAYPFVQIAPKAYRFEILNASNDRSLNLSLFYAGSESTAGTFVPCTGPTWTGTTLNNNGCSGEVPMVPAVQGAGTAGYTFPDQLDNRAGGVPDARAAGPSMVQIGTEGGVLPAPVTIKPQPVGYNYNRRDIVVLNVSNHSLLLGPAERADVIVDFSGVPAGSTLILYNDSGAPVPAFDPRNDYYTGDPDQTSTGGAPSTLPGYGPNTRTIMQFQVAGSAGAGLSPNLATAIPALYAQTQPKPIVAESAYNGAFGTSYTDQYMRIQDQKKTFVTGDGNTVTNFPFQPKAIQELFETNYGRMNATLGTEIPNTNGVNQTTVPLGYAEPITEIISPSQVGVQIGSASDGTQIWKITHNGVDTHAIHFHLMNVQLINRVGWDGAIRPPDANELGWKETIRMNPLEDAIVALRPTEPLLPFGVPDSIRVIDPTMPEGMTMTSLDPLTGGALTWKNDKTNFGWEYVWHCHLLGHEENDMMRPIKFVVPSTPPKAPALSSTYGSVILSWTDGTPNGLPLGDPSSEVGYTIWRAQETNTTIGAYTKIAAPLANATTYTDIPPDPTQTYDYQVFAWNAAAPLDAAGVGGVGSNVLRVTPNPKTTTAVVSSVNPSVFGQTVTFTATVSPVVQGLPNQPTGTMTWTVDTTTTTSPVLAGIATLPISTLTVGSHYVSGAYGGDANFLPSASTPVTVQVVNQAGSTSTVISSPSPSTYGQSVTFTATVTATAPGAGTPTGTVTFSIDGTNVGSPALDVNGQATYTAPSLTGGTHSVVAVYAGDLNFSGSNSATLSQVVNTAPSTTVVVSNINPSTAGQNVTFTATVSPPTATGTVTFIIDGTRGTPVALSAGSAAFSTTSLAVGAHPVIATYNGDTNYAASSSPTLTQTVGPALRPTNTVVTSNRNPSANYGQNITFTATVTPVTGTGVPTGTVQFNIDGVNVGGALTLNAAGRATYATAGLTAGSHSVIATYSGSAVFAGGGSATFTQLVNKVASTTVVTSNRNPASVFGQSVTFTARVTPLAATGTVQFTVDGTAVGGPVTLDATGRATLVTSTLAVGSHTISATYSGNTNYNVSSGSLTRPVNKANSRTVVTTSGTPATRGTTVTFTARVTAVAPGVGVPTGTVQFRIDGNNVGTALALNSSGQAAYSTSTLAVGLHTVSAVYTPDPPSGFNASASANINQRIR